MKILLFGIRKQPIMPHQSKVNLVHEEQVDEQFVGLLNGRLRGLSLPTGCGQRDTTSMGYATIF